MLSKSSFDAWVGLNKEGLKSCEISWAVPKLLQAPTLPFGILRHTLFFLLKLELLYVSLH